MDVQKDYELDNWEWLKKYGTLKPSLPWSERLKKIRADKMDATQEEIEADEGAWFDRQRI